MNMPFHGISQDMFDALAAAGAVSMPFASWPLRSAASMSSCGSPRLLWRPLLAGCD